MVDSLALEHQLEATIKSAAHSLARKLEAQARLTIDAILRGDRVASVSRVDLTSTLYRYRVSVGRQLGVSVDMGTVTIQIDNTPLKDLAQQLKRGKVSGGSLSRSLWQAVRGQWAYSEERAWQIARTEIRGAQNSGARERLRRAGYQKVKWVSVRDKRSRKGPAPRKPDHYHMHGVIVSIHLPFKLPTGEICWYPGEARLPARERINCRCRLRGVR